MELAEKIKERTKRLALDIIKLYQLLPKSDEAKIIGKQLIRSATSVAANYRAVCRARSDSEFYSKICIVVEESDEVVFWLELLYESKIVAIDKVNELAKEASEILAIMSSSKKTVRSKIDSSKLIKINKSTNQ